tara:strand:+ start:1140 stop:2018 length:879 start_codon:yes stop_codon:yes gene_type:complete
MKKLLIVFFDSKGETRSIIMPIEDGKDLRSSLNKLMLSLGVSPEQIIKYFAINTNKHIVPEKYLSCFKLKDEELVFDNSQILFENFDFWMNERQDLFKELDVEFLKALENQDQELISKTKDKKRFLRDLPNFVPLKFAEVMGIEDAYAARDADGKAVGVVDSYDALSTSQQIYYQGLVNERFKISEILKYTPFHNILHVDVIDEGSGYFIPPKINFECDYEMAFPPLCKTIVEGGKLKEVKVLAAGCGMVGNVFATVSPPEQEGGRVATVSAETCNKTDINYFSFEALPQEN